MKKFLVLAVLLMSACNSPIPTQAQFSEQRKIPFFKVLVYERAQFGVEFVLFEDEAGGCYITSGTDGGITQLRDRTACDKAKAPALETSKTKTPACPALFGDCIDASSIVARPISAKSITAGEITDKGIADALEVTPDGRFVAKPVKSTDIGKMTDERFLRATPEKKIKP